MFKNYVLSLKKEFLGYDLSRFQKDLLAGITVAAVALPLALAFGVSSGADAVSYTHLDVYKRQVLLATSSQERSGDIAFNLRAHKRFCPL